MILKRGIIFVISISGLILAALLALSQWISWRTAPYIYDDINAIPSKEVGIVLGTAKYYRHGGINLYYHYRIEGAIALYQQQKIQQLLLSGDNRKIDYNEPKMMRIDLIKRGIPKQNMILDYAGFRTLDSIIRAKNVFDTNNFTIITQKFHCERAIFIALHQNIEAQCLAVNSPETTFIKIRELFARIVVFTDLYIFNKQPHFLGPLIPIKTIKSMMPPSEKELPNITVIGARFVIPTQAESTSVSKLTYIDQAPNPTSIASSPNH